MELSETYKNKLQKLANIQSEQKVTKDKEPFDKNEQKIMDLLVEAHNIFTDLKKTHPSEELDWTNGIHTLQRLMGQRVLRRDYPNYFYSQK